jgi:hypothetical protein
MHNGLEVNFLARHQRKGFPQIKAHLMTENAQSASLRSICFWSARVDDGSQKIVINAHESKAY